MIGTRQFSLGFLFGEVGLFALAMGLTRLAYTVVSAEPHLTDNDGAIGFVLIFFGVIPCWGAAIGGLFGKMAEGAVFTLIGFVLLALLLPAVQ